MKHGFVFLAIATAVFSSCSTYRAGQTPDDVYYSPARQTDTYVQTNQDEENRTTYNQQDLEDQRLRQQIRDQRFRNFDDDFYWNNPYNNPAIRYNSWNSWNNWNSPWAMNSWGTRWNTWNLGWNSWSAWNNPWGWNSWNSPFVCVPGTTIIIPGPGAPKNSTGIRYYPGVQNYNNAGPRTGFSSKGGYTNGNTNGGSRYFGGASNNNGGRRNSSFFNDFFGGGNNSGNSGRSYNNGNGSRSFGNEGGFGGGNRSFGNGGSSGGSSGGGSRSSGSSGGTGGRRN